MTDSTAIPPDEEHDDRFEAQLDGFPTVHSSSRDQGRDPLEVLTTEFLDRFRSGQIPSVEEYQAKNPEYADQIGDLFPLLITMESAKIRREQTERREEFTRNLKIERTGPYRLVQEIGRGGMGIVYEAVRDDSPGACEPVAVKLLPIPIDEAGHWAELFQREARLASRLDHRNIVPVHHFGRERDFCYYVMPLIRGVSLDRLLIRFATERGIVYPNQDSWAADTAPPATTTRSGQEKPLGPKTLRNDSWTSFAMIAFQVARALDHAHGVGMVHRDIKPANLMLDASGHAWVTDFGLAVVQSGEANLDEDTGLGGTLRYMAPEQLRGEFDARSDVYALGVTLYELCCQEPAILTNSRSEMLEKIAHRELVPLRHRRAGVPAGLETITMRATARDPARRYATAGEMAGALLRFVNGLPVEPLPWWKRMLRRLSPGG